METTKINPDKGSWQSDELSLPDFSEEVLEYGNKLFENTTNDFGNFYKYTKSKQDHTVNLLTIALLWHQTKNHLSIDAIFYSPLFSFLNKRKGKRYSKLNSWLKNTVLYTEHNKEIPLNQRFEYLNAWVRNTNLLPNTYDLINSWQYWSDRLPQVKQQEIWDKLEEYADWFIGLLNFYSMNTESENPISSIEYYLMLIEKIKNEFYYHEVDYLQNSGNELISA